MRGQKPHTGGNHRAIDDPPVRVGPKTDDSEKNEKLDAVHDVLDSRATIGVLYKQCLARHTRDLARKGISEDRYERELASARANVTGCRGGGQQLWIRGLTDLGVDHGGPGTAQPTRRISGILKRRWP